MRLVQSIIICLLAYVGNAEPVHRRLVGVQSAHLVRVVHSTPQVVVMDVKIVHPVSTLLQPTRGLVIVVLLVHTHSLVRNIALIVWWANIKN